MAQGLTCNDLKIDLLEDEHFFICYFNFPLSPPWASFLNSPPLNLGV